MLHDQKQLGFSWSIFDEVITNPETIFGRNTIRVQIVLKSGLVKTLVKALIVLLFLDVLLTGCVSQSPGVNVFTREESSSLLTFTYLRTTTTFVSVCSIYRTKERIPK